MMKSDAIHLAKPSLVQCVLGRTQTHTSGPLLTEVSESAAIVKDKYLNIIQKENAMC